MASASSISNSIAQKEALSVNIATSGFGGAKLTIYSNSTTQPADADSSLPVGAIALAEIILPSAESNTVSNGVITFGAISTVKGLATGIASYFRVTAANGDALLDGNVGLAAATPDLVLDNTTITINEDVAITSFTHTIPKK